MATAYERVKEELALKTKKFKGKAVHAEHCELMRLGNLYDLLTEYAELAETLSWVAKLLPGARVSAGEAHIEDVFTAFQEFFQDVQKMQTNWPVAAWGKQLDLARDKLKTSLATIGLAQHINWEPRQ